MGAEQQQGGFSQAFLLEEWPEKPRHDQSGEARSLSTRHEESQASTAPARALTVNLMEEVTDRDNLRLKQRKRAKSITAFLHGLGVPWDRCWTTAVRQRLVADGSHPAAQQGMNNAWFQTQGLVNPLDWYLQLQHERKPPDSMITSGGVRGRER